MSPVEKDTEKADGGETHLPRAASASPHTSCAPPAGKIATRCLNDHRHIGSQDIPTNCQHINASDGDNGVNRISLNQISSSNSRSSSGCRNNNNNNNDN
eukprot:CAMPEP_0206568264 /NCGR_PEP_ID=MMETSP0325_2-20121206/25739_1 /ASSEMBLY_ACC=CAM_ASM_000347 /TAXON_ID=2866 /ORGANISM="Crypthecodinium cohnii, Strain Seligo" /LENGTH=98 /DNA_ID=CAMNT_0054071629 /DNA_START=126 /DNA_END=419 /DNA_ORIENTATION=+